MESYYILESQIREIYGRVVYTHKTHEKCADILTTYSNRLKCVEIFLSAATTTSILVVLFGEDKLYQVIAALISTVLLGLNLYSNNFKLEEIAEKHKRAALDVLEIRECILSLITDLRIGNIDIDKLQLRRDSINKKLIGVYRGAPKSTNKAYSEAVKALKSNEEFTFTDDEIDKFLPETLRRTKKL